LSILKFLEKDMKVMVRSRISKKVLVRPVSYYVNGKLYNSLTEYLEMHIREIKRRGFNYSLDEIIQNAEVFKKFVEHIVHPEYKIEFEEINNPIWIFTTFKKGTQLFLVLEGNSIPSPTLKFINQILSTYGFINKKPKYEAKSIKRNV